MVFSGERCLKMHRFMFTILGLWPYQKPFIWRIQAIFFFTSYCCTLFFQFTPFLTTTCDMECLLKRFCYICICLVYVFNYYSFYFNSECVKQSMEHMQLDWKMFENSDAMEIFEEYLFESYIFLFSACISIVIAGCVLLTIECRSVILDIIIPMNESRPRKIEIDFESFVDQQQYFSLYIIQEILGAGIGICSIIATGTFLITIGKHLSAVYKIASCLIQNTVTVYTLQIPAPQRMHLMHRNVSFSVHIHRRTMQFCEKLLLSFNWWYFPLVSIGVISLSCLLFRLYTAIIQFTNYYDIFVSCMLLYCYLAYMFLGNFLAQSYTDHSVELLESIYNTLWYAAPLQIQKLFLIMQKSIKSHKLVMGGLFVPSIEGFSALMTSAVSYFTVIHAMRS